jgi:hypothetical protein
MAERNDPNDHEEWDGNPVPSVWAVGPQGCRAPIPFVSDPQSRYVRLSSRIVVCHVHVVRSSPSAPSLHAMWLAFRMNLYRKAESAVGAPPSFAIELGVY